MKLLAGRPLLAYAIDAAKQSGVFSDLYVASDDSAALHFAYAHADVSRVLKRNPVADDQPDIDWVREVLHANDWDAFAILRPTSPFRTADTIKRAFIQFRRTPDVDSMRAVEPAKQHPGKMWQWSGAGYPMTPIIGATREDGTPWHSSPTQSLPTYYVQNSSLEMAWTRTVTQLKSIAGRKVLPFFTEGDEGFSIDYPEDWERAEQIAGRYAHV